MTGHAVVTAGGGPTGLMLAGELALAGIDVAIAERRARQNLPGSRAGGLHARTIEVLDQRAIADRFLSQGQVAQVAGFAMIPPDISDFPTRHPYGLGLGQNRIERILAGSAAELAVPIYREREVTGCTQDDTGVDVQLPDGQSLRAEYLAGCDGGRGAVRTAAGIEFPGWVPTTSSLIAEVELAEEPQWGTRRDDQGIHSLSRQAASYRDRRVLLAGDAHVHPPVGGQGLNIGVQDAVNPGWKRAQVVSGTSPESLLGRRRPDLDLITAGGPLRVFALLHEARPVLLNLGAPGGFDITPWADRAQLIDATYDGTWELPVLDAVTAPAAVLIRPDGHVAWVGDGTDPGLPDARTTWFGPPNAAAPDLRSELMT